MTRRLSAKSLVSALRCTACLQKSSPPSLRGLRLARAHVSAESSTTCSSFSATCVCSPDTAPANRAVCSAKGWRLGVAQPATRHAAITKNARTTHGFIAACIRIPLIAGTRGQYTLGPESSFRGPSSDKGHENETKTRCIDLRVCGGFGERRVRAAETCGRPRRADTVHTRKRDSRPYPRGPAADHAREARTARHDRHAFAPGPQYGRRPDRFFRPRRHQER